ncbi:microtubule associated protein [Gigaspora rosea]|uniref:Microtubule associated protein n=1 Tax=Gigaspora rosea TaxID=44941 RepID=A0A397VLJ9_9GLOM|nr:microtubule associated protein [Gigaspora rosea]
MDALHFKIDHLKLLWSEYRIANDGVDRDYSDHSEWARKKLQAVLSEFDKLIQEQILWKSSLSAEIEDLLVEIEEFCNIFGRRVDTIIPKAAALNVELNDTTRDNLKCIRDSLREEINLTQANVKKWLDDLRTFVIELDVDYKVPPDEVFENDLSSSVVEPVKCKYDEMAGVVVGRRNEFEESAIKLHYYWDALHHIPNDEIDEGLFDLFSDKQNPKDVFEALLQASENKDINSDDDDQKGIIDSRREYVYYTPQLPTGLKLTPECIAILKEKSVTLGKDYEIRKKQLAVMQKDVKNLYNELNTPLEERIELIDSLDEEYMERLSLERDRLKEIMRVIIEKAIEEYTAQLVELWDKCLVPQFERDEFFANVHKLTSSQDVYELLAHEVARLQELYAKCAEIYRLMLERRALISKMIEFEKKASDPRRLFQSSFRLLEEEKWRKSCWPNLVRIEDQLVNACINYEETERKPFMHESMRYLDNLQSEISERIVNQMFFGFEKDAAKGQIDQSQTNLKRKDSQLSLKTTPSRSVSPNGLNDNYSSRRNSQLISSRPSQSRPVSPTRRNSMAPSRQTSPTRRNSRAPSRPVSPSRRNSMAPSRPTSPTRRNSRAPSRPVSPTRRNSRAPSRPVSPSRRNSMAPSRTASPSRSRAPSRTPSRAPSRATSPVKSKRSSLYLPSDSTLSSSSTLRTPKSSNGPSPSSRRSSMYASNLDSQSGIINSHRANKSIDDKSRRSSLILDKGNSTAQRSNSVSSTSSESSASSIAAPTTPEPSLTSSDGDNGKSQPNISIKNNVKPKMNNDKSISQSKTRSLIPPLSTARKTNTGMVKARPRSIIGGISEPTAMLKKQASKRMSMIMDNGH